MKAPAPSPDRDAWRARHPVSRALDVFALIVVFGILAGFVHSSELVVARYFLGRLTWFSRDFLWMSPIAYTIALLPGGILLALLALASGARWVLAFAMGAAATAAVFGVLLPYSQIARIVSLFVAIVIGAQLARATLSSPNRALQRVRRVAVAGAALVALLALLIPTLRGFRERSSGSAAAALDAPNVLLIILDTVRAASFGLYPGAPPTTPKLTRWAAEGAVFDNAYVTAPWTLPSHGSFFTGRYAGELDADWKYPLGEQDSTLAEVFRARGYATGGFVGNAHYAAWDSGLGQGFVTYRDYRTTWKQLLLSSSYTQTRLVRRLRAARSWSAAWQALDGIDLSIEPKHVFDHRRADDISGTFLQWQRAVGARPFFAFLNYFDAHQTYYSPKSFQTYPPSKTGIDKYHAAITWIDSQVSALLDTLRARNVLDSTLVIITADHGELFAEHGLSGHANSLYRNVLHVPMWLRFPGRVPANRRVPAVVSLRDLPATIADLVEVARSPLPGASLAMTWSEAAGRTSPVIAEVTPAPNVDPDYSTARTGMTALIDSAWYYIRTDSGNESLFHLSADPGQTRDLAAEVDFQHHISRARARVDSIRRSR